MARTALVNAELKVGVSQLTKQWKELNGAYRDFTKKKLGFAQKVSKLWDRAKKMDETEGGANNENYLRDELKELIQSESRSVLSKWVSIGHNATALLPFAQSLPPQRDSLYALSLASQNKKPIQRWITKGSLSSESTVRQVMTLTSSKKSSKVKSSKMMEVLPDVCVLETVQVYLNTISTKGVGRATEVKEGGASEGGATGVGGAKLTLYCCGLCDSYLPTSQGQMLEWARKGTVGAGAAGGASRPGRRAAGAAHRRPAAPPSFPPSAPHAGRAAHGLSLASPHQPSASPAGPGRRSAADRPMAGSGARRGLTRRSSRGEPRQPARLLVLPGLRVSGVAGDGAGGAVGRLVRHPTRGAVVAHAGAGSPIAGSVSSRPTTRSRPACLAT